MLLNRLDGMTKPQQAQRLMYLVAPAISSFTIEAMMGHRMNFHPKTYQTTVGIDSAPELDFEHMATRYEKA